MSVNYLSLGDFNAEEKENGKQTMGYSLRGFTVKNKNKSKTMRKTKDNFFNTNNNQIVDHIDEMKDEGLNYVDCKYSQLEMFNELNVEHSEDEVEKKGKKSKKKKKEEKKKNANDFSYPNTIMKRPYSAHGYKVTNTKLKLTKRDTVNKDELITAYKEKFLASDINLLDCFVEKKKKISENKIQKPKLIKRRSNNYMKPLNREDKKSRPETAKDIKPSNNVFNDSFEDKEEEEYDEKIAEKKKKEIYGDTKKYKHTNEMLNELKDSLPKRDLLKLLNNMAKSEEKNEKEEIKVENIVNEEVEDEEKKYYNLRERIKNEIKKKGNFDFTKLTKEEHDLLAKRTLYEKIEKKKQKEQTIVKPKLIKRNVIIKKKDIVETQEQSKNMIIDKEKNKFKNRAKFQKPQCEIINNALEYIPKPSMNGFLLHSYTQKRKITIVNDAPKQKTKPIKPIPSNNFNSNIIDNKTITHPLLVENGEI